MLKKDKNPIFKTSIKKASLLLKKNENDATALLLVNKQKAAKLLKKKQATASKLLRIKPSKIKEKKETAKLLLKNELVAAKLLSSEQDTAAKSLLHKQLIASELLLQTQLVVENSQDAIIGTTLNGIITSWNRGAYKMFGYLPQDIIGKSGKILFPPEIWNNVPKLLKRVGKGEVIADYDIYGLRKNGSRLDLGVSISPIVTKDSKIVGASIVERDITERVKALREVKELSMLRSKFIEIISHQLRTPLTAINWNLELLLNGQFGKMEEIQNKFLRATYNASLEITHRITNLLHAMDIEEGRTRYEIEGVNLKNICTGSINEILNKCLLKNILLTFDKSIKSLPDIQGDGNKIRIAVSTILENAIYYTKEKGKIDASLKLKNNVVRFTVTDNGVGIPKAEQSLIFTRFFRASNASVMQQDAFGLNLFVAKNYIEHCGGKIGFTSTEGKGSTFWIELPVKN